MFQADFGDVSVENPAKAGRLWGFASIAASIAPSIAMDSPYVTSDRIEMIGFPERRGFYVNYRVQSSRLR
jgi:hypothetical protein